MTTQINFMTSKANRNIKQATEAELDRMILEGTVEERIAIARLGYKVDTLARDTSSAVRIQAVLNGADPTKLVQDSSQQVRFNAVIMLSRILENTRPKIGFSSAGVPYIHSTPEREALERFTYDPANLVHIAATKAMKRLMKKELEEFKFAGYEVNETITDAQLRKINNKGREVDR